MDPRVRAVLTAQKRPAAYEVDASEGDASLNDGWEIPAFDEFLAAHEAQTLQVFRARTNTTVAKRNAWVDIIQSKAEKIPASTFVCTHWGKYNYQTTGKRPRQEIRRKGCNAQFEQVGPDLVWSGLLSLTSVINACVQMVDPKKRTFAFRIIRCQMEHNHRLNSVSYKSHPINRLNLDEIALGTVVTLQQTETGIFRYILENTYINLTPKDVQNLVLKLKAHAQRDGPSTSGKRLKKWMKEFGAQSGNVGRVFLDDVGNKVLFIDATHGTNRSKHKGFSFMAHDSFGKGQFVQHALLQNERYETLLTAIEEFKRNNQSMVTLQCVLVDKDFTELLFSKHGVTVLLYQFHILKYQSEEIVSSNHGFSKAQNEQLRDVMSLLVYAKTEAENDKHFAYLVHFASIGYSVAPSADTVTQQEMDRVQLMVNLTQTENRNWDNFRELWCAHKRQNAVTLGNNTNNRLEASRKQLKE
ncbi:LOW QUALITY PROTEIN: hypothetical protein PHPALM_29203 [Phytophthora palmivora]|uniref:ZSWIM1/3 RNaseH-like domain-containing protein n=1 Tax=Phytophthora palmivora TaxID=4796 RepID=A0A2P4X864_9STRA|nr:LOW QUALITY PROTEIN: hypothetical protein PHPALM_29203 [Phytophthora palmivora]